MSDGDHSRVRDNSGVFAEAGPWIFHIRPANLGFIATAFRRDEATSHIDKYGKVKWYYDPTKTYATSGPFLTAEFAIQQCGAKLI